MNNSEPTLDPPPPYSEDAEQAVLSAMLMDPDANLRATEFLDDTMFYREGHRRIFRAMVALSERGDVVDPLTLSEELQRAGSLESSGGKDYIGFLVDAVPTAANVEYHAKIVHEKALRRRLIEVSRAIVAAAFESATPATELLDSFETNIRALELGTGRKARRIALTDDVELMDLVPPPWLVENILPGNGLAEIFGPQESLKSFVAVDLACHIATGMDWHGHRLTRGPVVYIVAEGAWGIKQRVAAWKKYYGITGKLGVYFLRTRIDVSPQSPDMAALIAEIRARVTPAPVLVIIDTVNRNLKGSENAPEDMSNFIAGCDMIREATGAAALGIHHTGYSESDRSRGHSSFGAALDTSIRCTRDGDRLELECKKQKDAEHFPAVRLETLHVHSSLVLRAMDQRDGKLDGNRLLCLQALHRFGDGASSTQWKKEAGLDKKNSSFQAARSWLVSQTYVRESAKGKYVVTDSGRLALGPLSIGSPSSVHSGADALVHPAGVCKDPAMDRSDELELDGGDSEEAWEPEEELELTPPDPA